ncbi:amidohydrolase family protein [Oceanimonas sp. CHS3-5]|uniref:amidohydrolase family protein n=1 Tax=Oceanimonas sp. CHS3-5 TaxID=3068186 RepID=UPI00273F49D6|nr:amidohydrolase family protein [Oceanimonas sp. CHS3-5]MDP5292513.1 amidohydrolase family protein [Oceanimonas sp. CHS3-5]
MKSTLLRNVRLNGQPESQDVLIEKGRITHISPAIAPPVQTEIVEGHHRLALPGFIDGHAHIDKSQWGMEWYVNEVSRDLPAIISNERDFRRHHEFDSQRQSERIARQAISMGTTHIRTHIDVDTEIGLRHVEGVLATKEKLAGQLYLETVCFPQSGLLGRPGTQQLMDDALGMGCDYVGGIDPSSFERDPVAHLDAIFALAGKHDKGVDIHLHEPGELGAFSVELITERTRRLGLKGRVTISHAFCLGEVDLPRQDALIRGLADMNIAIATTAPSNRPVPPYEKLRAAGIRVTAGNDGIRDTWSPYGNSDMLQRAMLMGLRYRWRQDREIAQALHAITQGGAEVMELEGYGLEPGCHADLVLVSGQTVAEIIANPPQDRAVFKAGKLVADRGECLF